MLRMVHVYFESSLKTRGLLYVAYLVTMCTSLEDFEVVPVLCDAALVAKTDNPQKIFLFGVEKLF